MCVHVRSWSVRTRHSLRTLALRPCRGTRGVVREASCSSSGWTPAASAPPAITGVPAYSSPPLPLSLGQRQARAREGRVCCELHPVTRRRGTGPSVVAQGNRRRRPHGVCFWRRLCQRPDDISLHVQASNIRISSLSARAQKGATPLVRLEGLMQLRTSASPWACRRAPAGAPPRYSVDTDAVDEVLHFQVLLVAGSSSSSSGTWPAAGAAATGGCRQQHQPGHATNNMSSGRPALHVSATTSW